jgi:uncharacterized protein (DUF1778 family)
VFSEPSVVQANRMGSSQPGSLPYNHLWSKAMPPLATISRKSSKRERLEARITPAQKRLIERAARLRGTSVTDFVVVSAQQAATEVIQDFEVLSLRGRDQEIFVNAILNPPEPSAVMKAAAARYKQRMGRSPFSPLSSCDSRRLRASALGFTIDSQ